MGLDQALRDSSVTPNWSILATPSLIAFPRASAHCDTWGNFNVMLGYRGPAGYLQEDILVL